MKRAATRLFIAAWGMIGLIHPSAFAEAAPISYEREIRPILADHCYTCHGPDDQHRKADLRLDLKEKALDWAIVPGKPDESEVFSRLIATDPAQRMPPPATGKQLTPQQIDLIKRWIEQGADWPVHWAYRKVERPPLPAIRNSAWPKNPIDRFLLARLEAEKLEPSPEANRAALIRRVSLDLTGLPPTPAEVDAFLADKSPDAYEKLVDRLLASPHYGERMAQDWLDQARYADTNGYHIDNHRDIWKWRDWVIDAYNSNKPFDVFTIEQIAGDLLPNATVDQKIATGFNRNEMVNFEGGAIEEEYATKYVVGRVNTTASVYLGLTMNCAECHDHKYDPISQREYYQFYAFFNNIAEKGLDGQKESPAPRLKLPTADQAARLAQLERVIASLEGARKNLEADLPARQSAWEQQILAGAIKPKEPAGLSARFGLDEASGVLMADTAANDRYALLKGEGSPARLPGRLGNALKFDGKGSHIDAGYVASFERTDAFSYGAWVNFEGNDGALITKMQSPPSLRGYDIILAGGRVFVHLIHNWPTSAIRVMTKAALPAKTWQHLLVTYDGSGKAAGVRIYVNGVAQPTDADHDTLAESIRTPAPLRLGRREEGFFLHGALDDVRIYARALSPEEALDLLAEPVLAVARIPAEQRTDAQKQELATYFRQRHAPELNAVLNELASTRKAHQELDQGILATMVMEERKEPRETRILIRGDYRSKGDRVSPNIPAFLPSLPQEMKPNRLALAKWLVDPANPLVSRVTVNRYWQKYFGVGLVKTSDDFGSRGELPIHPQLLDWLAAQFIESGWDIKAMQRLIVTSAAYRQSSVVSKELLSRDPENRLLARGPRFRLSAEEIRDNALAISGLLYPKIGGPSVFPYQPAGLWEAGAFGGEFSSQTYIQSHGNDLYRRGLYTYWKRSMPYPSFTAFDAPNRETCTIYRPRTNTPLQALVLLNDPVYVEAARALAQRIMKEGGTDPSQRIAYAFRLCLARPPQPAELQVLLRLYKQQAAHFQNDPAAAQKLLSVGESPRDPSLAVPDLAAWTAVANMLLNLDEAITKG